MNKIIALALMASILSGCSTMQRAPNYSAVRNSISSVAIAESMPYIVRYEVGNSILDRDGMRNAVTYAEESLAEILGREFVVANSTGAKCLLSREGRAECHDLFNELANKKTKIDNLVIGENLKQCLNRADTQFVVLSCLDGFYRSTGNKVMVCGVSIILIPLSMILAPGMIATVIPYSYSTVVYTAVYDTRNNCVVYYNKSGQHGSPLKKKEISNAYAQALSDFIAHPDPLETEPSREEWGG